MSEQFTIFKDKIGEYRFNLKAPNHETILASEGYKQSASVENGIKSVKENAPNDANYQRLIAKDGQFYFNLKAVNREIIGVSETYTTVPAREKGIEAVKKYAPTAGIKDDT